MTRRISQSPISILLLMIGISVIYVSGIAGAKKALKTERDDLTRSEKISQPEIKPVPVEVPPAEQAPSSSNMAGEQINWQVMAGGGGECAASGYRLNGTLGQAIAGWTASGEHSVHQGYWQKFASAEGCCDLAGDANNDGEINVGDCVYMIDYIFRYGPPPACMDEADANADCEFNIGDAVMLVTYIFKYGPPPECGCIP